MSLAVSVSCSRRIASVSIVASEKLFYVALCRHTLIKTSNSQKPNPESKKYFEKF